MGATTGKSSSYAKNVFAAVFYAFVSISTTFFNKAVLSVYNFEYTNSMLLAQHILTIAVLHLLKFSKLITFPSIELQKCKELLPVSLLYSLNVLVALSALRRINIPMYGVLKRVTTLFVLAAESYILNKPSSTQLKQSVVVIVAGAVVAGAGDLTFDPFGYLMATVSCLVQTGYLIYMAKSGSETGINQFGLLYYNSILSIPFCVLTILGTDELQGVLNYPLLTDTSFLVCLFTNLIFGSILNFSVWLCATTNSALTTSIMGHVKAAVSVVLGLFLFGGVEITLLNGIGLLLNTLGGIWYSHIKYEEGQAKQRNKQADV